MKVVLDTNILVAASRSNRGASYKILSLIPDKRFQICISLPVYFEYRDVLTRPEHLVKGRSIKQTEKAINYLLSQAHLQDIFFYWRPYLPDPKDDVFLELAVAASAKQIITFNQKHFRGTEKFGIVVTKPRDFLVEIGEIE